MIFLCSSDYWKFNNIDVSLNKLYISGYDNHRSRKICLQLYVSLLNRISYILNCRFYEYIFVNLYVGKRKNVPKKDLCYIFHNMWYLYDDKVEHDNKVMMFKTVLIYISNKFGQF